MAGTGNPFVDGAIGVLDFGKSLFTDIVNYRNQQEEQQYQRQLQQTIFDREDNALQRGVQDALRAGLSPLSASGAGTGQIATSVTPHLDDSAKATQAMQFAMDMQTARQNLEIGKDNSNLLKAQKDLVDQQTRESKTRESWENIWNSMYQDLGITPNATEKERMLAMMLKTLKGEDGGYTQDAMDLMMQMFGLSSFPGISQLIGGSSVPEAVENKQVQQTETNKKLNEANAQRSAEFFGLQSILVQERPDDMNATDFMRQQALKIADLFDVSPDVRKMVHAYSWDPQKRRLTLLGREANNSGQMRTLWEKILPLVHK